MTLTEGYQDIVMLLDEGTDLDLTNNEGTWPPGLAEQVGQQDIVDMWDLRYVYSNPAMDNVDQMDLV